MSLLVSGDRRQKQFEYIRKRIVPHDVGGIGLSSVVLIPEYNRDTFHNVIRSVSTPLVIINCGSVDIEIQTKKNCSAKYVLVQPISTVDIHRGWLIKEVCRHIRTSSSESALVGVLSRNPLFRVIHSGT